MLRVVCDTSTLVSALLYRGNERKLLDLATEGRVLLFSSEPILSELEEVLSRSRFDLSLSKQSALVHSLRKVSTLVVPRRRIRFVEADPDDDKLLECAAEAHADYLVSGDHHLLSLGRFEDVCVVSTTTLLAIIGA